MRFNTYEWVGGRKALAVVAAVALLIGGGLGVGIASSKGQVAPTGAAAMALAGPAQAGPAQGFADLVEKVGASVVNIRVTKVEKTAGPEMFGQGTPFDEFFEQFFGQRPGVPRERRQQGAGSGFVIDPSGLIVTNNHVVEGAKEVTVTLADKTEYAAKVVGRDPKTDLALLKVEPKGQLSAAPLGDSEALRVGEWVVAVGNPFGLSNTVTAGIVSAKGRVIGAGPYDDFIQTDAPINPGNSGGPLFNLKGEVVGINTAIVPNGQGIGFAVPVNQARALLPQLEAKGEVTRGYLGVQVQAITPELAKSLKLADTKGALVAGITKGGPADAAGILQGDVVIGFNGKPIAEVGNLPGLVAVTPVDSVVPVKILRDGAEKTLTVTVGRMPSERGERAGRGGGEAEPTAGKWGLALRDLDERTAQRLGVAPGDGVLVAGVRPGSPGERAGVRAGDVIQEVNRHKVASVKDVRTAAEQPRDGGSVLLLLKRGDGSLFAALQDK
jgi:serine protease Do